MAKVDTSMRTTGVGAVSRHSGRCSLRRRPQPWLQHLMMRGQQRQRSQARQTADEAAVLDESTTPDEREELAITGEPRLSFNLAMSKAKLEPASE